MGDASRQPADAFHLLGLQELFLDAYALGDVREAQDDAGEFFLEVTEGRRRCQVEDSRAVLQFPYCLTLAALLATEYLSDRATGGVAQRAVQDLIALSSRSLLSLQAEQGGECVVHA